jgi:hypothetical protein
VLTIFAPFLSSEEKPKLELAAFRRFVGRVFNLTDNYSATIDSSDYHT